MSSALRSERREKMIMPGYRFHLPRCMKDIDEPNTIPVDLWRGLIQDSSAHGFQNLGRAKGHFKKGFWVAAMLLMTAGLCYNLKGLTMNYLRHPITVAISLVHEQQLVFPAVTICNLNPVRKSALDAAMKGNPDNNIPMKRRRRKRSAQCPNNWTPYMNNCYFVSTSTANQSAAQKACQTNGSDLVSINDQAEYYFTITLSPSETYWIGLYKKTLAATDDSYWLDNSTSGYRAWWPGPATCSAGSSIYAQPDASSQCVLRSHECSAWIVYDCTLAAIYICKISGALTTTTVPTTTTMSTKTTQKMTTTTQQTTTNRILGSTSIVKTTPRATTLQMTSTSKTTTPIVTTTHETTTSQPTTTHKAATPIVTTTTETTTLQPTTTFEKTATPIVTTTTETMTSKTTTTSETTKPIVTTRETTTSQPTATSEASSPITTTASITATLQKSTTKTTTSTPTTVVSPKHIEDTTTTTTFESTTSPSKNVSIGCCCQCCLALFDSEVCQECTNTTLDSTAKCASVQPPVSQHITTPTHSPASDVPNFSSPPSIPGSAFSNRKEFTPSFITGEALIETVAALPEATKINLGYTLGNMVLQCRYAGLECDNSDFETFYNAHYGNCYMFNSGWNKSKTLYTATSSGRRSGLKMTMNIRQEEYIPDIGDSAGLRLVIHPQGAMAFPEDEGVTISPGHFTSVAIKKSIEQILSEPYSNCTDDLENDARFNGYILKYPVNYSREACLRTCYQSYVIKACSCTDPYYPEGVGVYQQDHPVCSITNITQDDCKYNLTLKFASNLLDCQCPDLCRNVKYQYIFSMGIWPSQKSRETTLRNLVSKVDPNFDISSDSAISDNLLKFEVFFQDLNYELMQEFEEYPLINFLSDMGGVVGLWFGFAFLTFLEFFEFFVDVIVFSIMKLFNALHRNTSV